MRKLITILLFPCFVFAQNKDWAELQGKIDTAVRYNGIVRVERSYVIDFPLVAAKWDSSRNSYIPFTIQILGNSTMWDVGGISQITYTGKDGFALGIHLGKGCVIRGLNIQGAYRTPNLTERQFFSSLFDTYGDTTCRDSRYSPYAGIVIDPFRAIPPPDGGYPGLQKWYRGSGSSGGSTGFTIDNCTINNFTVQLIFSPNGQTANCELMTVSNIRMYNGKAGIVGCQAQEKNNSFYNINCWGRMHTLFAWGVYGNGTPGMYDINRVQIAGGVVRLLSRNSGGYFPLTISGVNAEMLGSIGYWQSLVGDRLTSSAIGFAPNVDFPPFGHLYGQANQPGVTIDNSFIRYYGKASLPILFNGDYVLNAVGMDQPIMRGYKATDSKPGYQMYYVTYSDSLKISTPLPIGSTVAFCNPGSWIWAGIGSIGPDGVTIINASSNIKPGAMYGIVVYKKL